MTKRTYHVGLYVTCLVDMIRPSVGFATVQLLEALGCQVTVPPAQTCCGQPAFNSGDANNAQRLTESVLNTCDNFDFVVVPSASCAAMLKIHLPSLLADTPHRDRATAFAKRIFELTEFLQFIGGFEQIAPSYAGRISFHDGCSGKRELGLGDGPRALLRSVSGAELVELSDTESCCGFGGTFSVRYPEISNAMVEKKIAQVQNAAPDLLTSCELGCLMNIAGKLRRAGSPIACRHISEVLAGAFSTPAIGATSAKV